jgi:hypothetical protein
LYKTSIPIDVNVVLVANAPTAVVNKGQLLNSPSGIDVIFELLKQSSNVVSLPNVL